MSTIESKKVLKFAKNKMSYAFTTVVCKQHLGEWVYMNLKSSMPKISNVSSWLAKKDISFTLSFVKERTLILWL